MNSLGIYVQCRKCVKTKKFIMKLSAIHISLKKLLNEFDIPIIHAYFEIKLNYNKCVNKLTNQMFIFF